ncbi:hypothetical protein C8A05DRAFT_48083 [Staphylotrichum tortipilum]|uniref:Uncharacterized protein n=1 Tax=Staphylotrichum tortipilum TaxID=2831512 RepID=A0AAN6MC25_9PEZI|nr:hypothetical protein C8A05DRAFT_48083 [Staphylotrichum longicolle]
MDDPADDCWNWPFWKFGLKRDDLFGSLHAQYNTFASPIQDPAAFHHDVYELSHKASTADELRRLLDDRKQQRMRELNETLQSASFEIIANPELVGTEQWQHAVQLFRTQSLDSLVRYFASYLPADHPWYRSCSTSASVSDAGSSVCSLTDSQSSFFDEDEETQLVDEPYEYPSYPKQQLPASPRSMTMCSDSSVTSPSEDERHEFDFAPTTPARTLSFSESEPDCCDGTSTPCPSCARGVESDVDTTPQSQSRIEPSTISLPTIDVPESSTPTPKPEAHSAAFFADAKLSLSTQRYRSRSPSRAHPLSLEHAPAAHPDPRYPQRSRFTRSQRECSPAVQRRRRSPGEPAARIKKSLPEVRRSRPRTRRLVDS